MGFPFLSVDHERPNPRMPPLRIADLVAGFVTLTSAER